MSQTLEIQEIAIVITAKNYDSSLLNPELLKYSAVIPEDWKIAKKPIASSMASQIVFQNKVMIASKPNNIMFVEAWEGKDSFCKIAEIANRYINVLRTVQYQAVGINFRGCVIRDANSTPNRYVLDNLIKSGDWQNCGATSIKPEVNLMFDYNDKQLNLNIKESLRLLDSKKVPVVIFNGNCHHNLISDNSNCSTLSKLETVIGNWQQDLELYQDTVAKFIDLQSSNHTVSNELKPAIV